MKLISFDKIKNRDEEYLYQFRIWYLDRINAIIQSVKKSFSNSRKKRILDIDCAQANLSLLLAKAGYDITAIDINKNFLNYAKKVKHFKGGR